MEALSETTVLFTLALTLSMIVERVLEIVKCTLDLLDSRFDWYRFWTWRAKVLQQKLERRFKIFEYAEPKFINDIIKAGHSILLGPDNGYSGTLPTVSGDLVRGLWYKIFLKVLGIIIGILLAWQFSIDLLALWQNNEVIIDLPQGKTVTPSDLTSPTVWGTLLTGAAIGLGSGPIHKIITAMEGSWENKKTLRRMKDL